MMAECGPSGSAGVWHYYAAVGNRGAKLTTLVELLQALPAACRRPLAICCSARDSLDNLVYWLLRSRSFAVTAIHSDLTDKERELALASFKRGLAVGTAGNLGVGGVAAAELAGGRLDRYDAGGSGGGRERAGLVDGAGSSSGGGWAGPGPGPGLGPGQQGPPGEALVSVLAVTDVCLKALPKELLPLGVSLLVEFDLPPSKEVYSRRVSALFGSGKDRRSQRCVVIDMVEAGAIGAFRTLEGFAASPVMEMPVRVEDMFVQQ
ncbi:hypothetical protein VOLCADRAFT_106205 [Volvox carteri f. nagariensis]|uniref:Helicase C-terminal domain-containing protein n=1 Tax=Volvox carteri f. nagariensis TaxID=3068 RepID=D8U5T4_VOLCA|nr:uncharacterized protein VOLCADRAFT_106205 [Volvox carteri f. nagariensis]EFJ44976.1 hypothetical protein VOLCADRAFT_106205 [Volvox carteri f. nagariensis]|eukprot:XP_002953947.1 hypothetical protein VOLCADRAFT_106205 [Volvox carteri f. nagariensis]